jgi:hypothetical protein
LAQVDQIAPGHAGVRDQFNFAVDDIVFMSAHQPGIFEHPHCAVPDDRE